MEEAGSISTEIDLSSLPPDVLGATLDQMKEEVGTLRDQLFPPQKEDNAEMEVEDPDPDTREQGKVPPGNPGTPKPKPPSAPPPPVSGGGEGGGSTPPPSSEPVNAEEIDLNDFVEDNVQGGGNPPDTSESALGVDGKTANGPTPETKDAASDRVKELRDNLKRKAGTPTKPSPYNLSKDPSKAKKAKAANQEILGANPEAESTKAEEVPD
jgi:hypothetical protein